MSTSETTEITPSVKKYGSRSDSSIGKKFCAVVYAAHLRFVAMVTACRNVRKRVQVHESSLFQRVPPFAMRNHALAVPTMQDDRYRICLFGRA